ncbi:cupin domain-containing protein [Sphingomonas sp. 37zxx]|uniref:cupin domain-containing protein n=1 Tax=Sphingomonas sp. 37zxx TaxID=1550073 RepID=UPI00053C0669|nr:cupin domain-containing protein [Sphingomonas sp. 37zxx]
MPKLTLHAFPLTNATGYPPEYAGPVRDRWYRRLGPASGLSQFGVSHVTLKPGACSSQRHWHEGGDEFVVILSGEAILIDDAGEQAMCVGDCASFPAGQANGHMLANRGMSDCVVIAVGTPGESDCHYPDIDMHLAAGQGFRRKDGSAF